MEAIGTLFDGVDAQNLCANEQGRFYSKCLSNLESAKTVGTFMK